MAWPKGKPRLSDEERAVREQRRERTLYPAMWEHVGCYYCPYKINGPFVTGRDDAAFDAARALTQEHIKEAHPGTSETRKRDTSKREGVRGTLEPHLSKEEREKRRTGPRLSDLPKHDEVLADAVEAEAKVADKVLRERVSRGRI